MSNLCKLGFYLLIVTVSCYIKEALPFCFQRQPSYLLPFFCLQVFDFCVNLLGAVGAISYIPELKLMLKNNVSCIILPFQFWPPARC